MWPLTDILSLKKLEGSTEALRGFVLTQHWQAEGLARLSCHS